MFLWFYFFLDFYRVLPCAVITTFSRDAVVFLRLPAPARPVSQAAMGASTSWHIDNLGRDLFTRMLYAARVSLSIAFSVVFLSEAIGVVIRLPAGYYKGWVHMLISRVIEFMITIPLLPILLFCPPL